MLMPRELILILDARACLCNFWQVMYKRRQVCLLDVGGIVQCLFGMEAAVANK